MKRLLAIAAAAILPTGLAFSQTPAPTTFEVADVHASPSSGNSFMNSGFYGGRYIVHSATLVDLIRISYGVEADAVYGGPSWLDSDRFEIVAKVPPRSSEADRQVMLQALLADRFKLVVHKEDKPQDVFTLTAGKKVLMKASEGEGRANCQPPEGRGPQPYIVLDCKNMAMADFATQFHQMAGGYVTHQVVDLTGLKGQFDFAIKWTPRGALRAGSSESEANPGISFFEAVDKQLGLKLAPEKRPMPAIVVDSVNRTPTDNAPGIDKALPPAPMEFDAASVKQNKSGGQVRRIQPKAGGRIEVENIPLKELIGLAWNVDRDPERIVGGPKWIETENFDIVAKTADFPMNSPPPFDQVRLMLQPLLKERFKLEAHMEDQPIPVWTLTVAKGGSKLKEADPASRSSCKGAPGDSTTVPMIVYTCQNTTMAQLAEAMHNFAGGYVNHPAVDMTGLTGGYDFKITWTPAGALMGGGRSGASGDAAGAGAAVDPNGGISFFEAVEKQLGLHLESGQKHPMPVLVIDHVEQLVEN